MRATLTCPTARAKLQPITTEPLERVPDAGFSRDQMKNIVTYGVDLLREYRVVHKKQKPGSGRCPNRVDPQQKRPVTLNENQP